MFNPATSFDNCGSEEKEEVSELSHTVVPHSTSVLEKA